VFIEKNRFVWLGSIGTGHVYTAVAFGILGIFGCLGICHSLGNDRHQQLIPVCCTPGFGNLNRQERLNHGRELA